MIKHENHRVPVTALAFSEDYLFAGEGSYLKIHRRRDNELLATRKIFASQAVHGVVVYPNGLIVWGGRYIAVYSLHFGSEGSVSNLEQTSSFEAIDWILDVSISPDNGTAAFVTAHNALLMLNLNLTETSDNLQELTSNSRCILYSAHLHWDDLRNIIIASGTVFGEIIVWSCRLQEEHKPTSILHHVLTGHEGSIFGVQIFDRSNGKGEDGPSRLLASCSDDRTVRIWDISNLPETKTDPQTAADLPSARETGFGANIADILPDAAAPGHCIAKAWGHLSRIWGVKFVPSLSPDHLSYLVSFGEDATCQFWSLEATGFESYALKHMRGSSFHSGKNIWSWALGPESLDRICIATGGADGSIALEPVNIPFEHESDAIQTWSIQDLLVACLKEESSGRQDKLRNYAFVNQSDLLVTTNEGNVLLMSDLPSKTQDGALEDAQVRWISKETLLRGYSVVTSIPSIGLAFLAGIDGTVFMYDHRGVKELVKSTGKTSALFAQLLSPTEANRSRVSLLVANVESKTSMLLFFDVNSSGEGASNIEVVSQWKLLMPPGFVPTTSLIASVGHEPEKDLVVVLGSRKGSMAIFSLRELEQDLSMVPHELLYDRAHGSDAVTDLAWIPNAGPSDGNGYVLSAGRDGTYAIHLLSGTASTTGLRRINQTSLPQGMITEGVKVDQATNHVLVWGFYRKRFVVFDVTDEREVMTVNCDGANRDWKFDPLSNLQGGHFAWTKASQLCLKFQTQQPGKVLGGGSHGREIKAVAVSPMNPMNYGVLIATGSEDTNIKIFAYQARDKKNQFRCIRTLRKHNTGIRQLEWSPDGRYLFSSGGFEELVVWKVQSAPLVGLGVFCESVCPTESSLPDLRIMGFSVKPLVDTDGFVVSIVRSDSTIRIYRYIPGLEEKWQVLLAGNYLTSCLTQCLHVEPKRSGSSLITGGTDGYIAFWPIDQAKLNTDTPLEPDTLSWTSRFKIHQNTIHCLKIHWLDDRSCLLLTGGDDNGVAISRCSWGEDKERPNVKTLIIPRAHAAAVTGLEVLKSDQHSLLIASTSIDQRVKTWEVKCDSLASGIEGVTVAKRQNEFTAVADVSGLALLEEDAPSVVVCGVGMDVWSHES